MSGHRRHDPHLASVRAAVAAHHAINPREQHARRRILAMLDWLPAPFDEHADPVHVTGSALVLDPAGRVLLHRHRRLGLWLQPGGHLDPGEHPAEAARREAHEETGVAAVHPADGPVLCHLDVHQGPRGHVHLDLRYRLAAPAGAIPCPGPGESRDVAWFSPQQAVACADLSLRAALSAVWNAVDEAALTTPRDGPR